MKLRGNPHDGKVWKQITATQVRMSKEFRSLGVFAAFSRWSVDVSFARSMVCKDYRLHSYTPKDRRNLNNKNNCGQISVVTTYEPSLC